MPTKSVDLPHLRNVVLAGHAGAGKTTLAEQLLFRTGAVPRPGKVDEGTASLDFEPEEQKRHESLSLAAASLDDEDTRVTLLDTPGYADFVAEVIEGFAAADGALFVLDASTGVESGLERAGSLGRRTTTASQSTSRARRSAIRSSRRACERASRSRSLRRCSSAAP